MQTHGKLDDGSKVSKRWSVHEKGRNSPCFELKIGLVSASIINTFESWLTKEKGDQEEEH
jgi:hypothetical protein